VLLRNIKSLIFAILSLTLVSTSSSARIIHVPADSSTIQSGINGASDGDTVLVARGHYYERINFYGKAILVASNFIFDNDTTTIDSTIIDADTLVLEVADTGSVVVFVSGEDSTSTIEGFTIENGIGLLMGKYVRGGGGIYCEASAPSIINNVISKNHADIGGGTYCVVCSPHIVNNTIIENASTVGGGIFCFASSPTISSNTIIQNCAEYGGGIYCQYTSSPAINTNIIVNNSVDYTGGGISCNESSPDIANNTIIRNSADLHGGGIHCLVRSSPSVTNNVIANNLNGEGIYCEDESYPTISYSDFWNNPDGDFVGCLAGVGDTTWGTNINGIPCDSFYNIIRDPLFVDSLYDYHLQEDSPCIDAGDNSVAPDSDLDGNSRIVDGNKDDSAVVDIGAYEYQPLVGIAEDNLLFSASDFVVFQNYPNPFNPQTTIEYYLPKPAWVNLTIYNILGRKINTLVNDLQSKGKKSVIWDGKNQHGEKIGTGVYFYRLQAFDYVESKKMVIIK
jgi:hypothetical protein